MSMNMCECERALVWARGMRLSRDGGEEGDRWGEIPLEVTELLAASSTLVRDRGITGKPALVSIV